MSRTIKGSKPPGWERYNSKRKPNGGAQSNDATHRYERRQAKAECREHMQ